MRLSRATHLAAFLAFLAAARAGGGGGAHGGAHGGANASLGHCPHFATDNSSEFHRVCGLGGSEEPHSGAAFRAAVASAPRSPAARSTRPPRGVSSGPPAPAGDVRVRLLRPQAVSGRRQV